MFNWYDSSETEAQEFEHHTPGSVRDHRTGAHTPAAPYGATHVHQGGVWQSPQHHPAGQAHPHHGAQHGHHHHGHHGAQHGHHGYPGALAGQHGAWPSMHQHLGGYSGFGGSWTHGFWRGGHHPGNQRWSRFRHRWPQYPWSSRGGYPDYQPDMSFDDDAGGDLGFAPPPSYQVPVPVPVPVPMPSAAPVAQPPDATVMAAAGPDPSVGATPPAVVGASAGEIAPWLHQLLDRELGQSQAEGWSGAPSNFEYETPRADPSRMLSFRIPDAPYSDELFSHVHLAIDIAENVHITLAIFGEELMAMAGAAGLAGEILLGPVAGMLLSFMALGAPYMEARAQIARERVTSGFAMGVVLGADGRKWAYVKDRYVRRRPEVNHFDEQAGVIATNAYNLGLLCGFTQGKKLVGTQKQRFLWQSFGRMLTPGDRHYFSDDRQQWGPKVWQDWYFRVAGLFIQLYVKP